MKKLEAVVICIGYSDFLLQTLPFNKNFFDKMVVVTDTQDKETARVCEFNNVQCVQTDVFYETNERRKPNKAKGINAGLKELSMSGWIMQLDADIYLPTLFRQIIQQYPLDETCIYGIDRLMCNNYPEWIKYLYQGKPLNEGWIYVHTNQFPMGERIVKYHSEGYLPIGYVQIWNPAGSGNYTYPEIQASYDRTDVLFAQKWKRPNRRLIADVICIHLASEAHKQGQNWQGRKTRPFRPMTLLEKIKIIYYQGLHKTKHIFKKTVPCVYCLPK